MLTLLSMDICSCLINIVPLKKFSFGSSGHHVLSTVSSRLLRAILCMNQAKWEMKNLTPPPRQILHAIRYCGGMSKNALCSGSYFIVVMVTPIVCW